MKKISGPDKIWRFLQRPDLLFYLLAYLMTLLVVGTVAQKFMGTFPAIRMFFTSFVLWYGILPLPGGALVLGAMFINLLVHFLVKTTWTVTGLGNHLAHLGILILLLGGGITLCTKQEGFLLLLPDTTTAHVYQSNDSDFLDADSKPAFTLPFGVTLEKFEQGYYPGTETAQYYVSTLRINGQSHYVAMNEPLRYRGYTFYQSSVLNLPGKPAGSVLSVVRNPGWLFPYLATALLFAGLVFHAGRKRYERR